MCCLHAFGNEADTKTGDKTTRSPANGVLSVKLFVWTDQAFPDFLGRRSVRVCILSLFQMKFTNNGNHDDVHPAMSRGLNGEVTDGLDRRYSEQCVGLLCDACVALRHLLSHNSESKMVQHLESEVSGADAACIHTSAAERSGLASNGVRRSRVRVQPHSRSVMDSSVASTTPWPLRSLPRSTRGVFITPRMTFPPMSISGLVVSELCSWDSLPFDYPEREYHLLCTSPPTVSYGVAPVGDVYWQIVVGAPSASIFSRVSTDLGSGGTVTRDGLATIIEDDLGCVLCSGTASGTGFYSNIDNMSWSLDRRVTGLLSKLYVYLYLLPVNSSVTYTGGLELSSGCFSLTDNVDVQPVQVINNSPSDAVVATEIRGYVEVAGTAADVTPLHVVSDPGPVTVATPVVLVGSTTTSPVWTSEVQPAPPVPSSWHVSMEDWNRRMHATNGNTCLQSLMDNMDRQTRDPPAFSLGPTVVEAGGFDSKEAQEAYELLLSQMGTEDWRCEPNPQVPVPADSSSPGVVMTPAVIPSWGSVSDQRSNCVGCSFVVAAMNHRLWGFECYNPYDDLSLDEEDALMPELAPLPVVPASEVVGAPAPAPKPGPAKPRTPPPTPKSTPKLAPQTPASPEDTKKRVMMRINARFASDAELLGWCLLSEGLCHRWAWQIMSQRWGRGWHLESEKWTPIQLLATVWVRLKHTRVGESQLRSELAAWGKTFLVCWKKHTDAYVARELDMVSPGWWSSVKVLASEQAAHNAFMHAYNGNPVLSPDMTAVRAMPTLDSYGDDVKTENRFDGPAAELRVCVTKNGQNPNNATLSNRSVLRCKTQNNAGAVTNIRTFEPLENYMVPRQIWNVAANALESAQPGLSWVHYSPFPVQGLDMVETPFWLQIGRSELEDNYQMGRPDASSSNGFRTWDVKFLGKTVPTFGLEMSKWAMTLKAWHSILMWQPGSTPFLPLSNDLGRFDPRFVTQPDLNIFPLTVNDGPIAAENWGGNNCTFPTTGGSSGALTFHVCLDTVPEEHKANIIVFPRVLCNTFTQNPAKAIAIMVACLAPWPFCTYYLRRSVANSLNANVANVTCTLFGNLVKLDGSLDIHILLPRQGTGLVPGNAGDANARALIRPVFGPAATAAYNPNDPIQVAYLAAAPPIFQVDLCQYLYSWALGISWADLSLFGVKLSTMSDMSSWFNLAEDRMADSVVRYSMVTTNLNPVWSNVTFRQLLPDGRALHIMDLGSVASPPVTNVLPAFNAVAWNHLALGTRDCPAAPRVNHMAGACWTRASSVYWRGLQARDIAYTSNLMFQTGRLMSRSWNNMYSGAGPNEAMRQYCGSFITGGAQGMALMGSRMGPTLHNIYKNITGNALFSDQFKNTLFDYFYFHENCFSHVHDGLNPATLADVYVPGFLPDAWFVGVVDRCPLSLAPYPSNFGLDATSGITRDDMSLVSINNNQAPPAKDTNQLDRLDEYSLPEWDDAELWNLRLLCEMAAEDGVGVICRNKSDVAQPVPVVRFYTMSAITLDNTIPAGSRISRTVYDGTWSRLAQADDDGTRLWYTVSAANMSGYQSVMVGLTRRTINTFLFANSVASSSLHWRTGRGSAATTKVMAQLLRNQTSRADPPGDLPISAAVEGLAAGLAAELAEPAVAAGIAAVRGATKILDAVKTQYPVSSSADPVAGVSIGINPQQM